MHLFPQKKNLVRFVNCLVRLSASSTCFFHSYSYVYKFSSYFITYAHAITDIQNINLHVHLIGNFKNKRHCHTPFFSCMQVYLDELKDESGPRTGRLCSLIFLCTHRKTHIQLKFCISTLFYLQ